MPVVMQHNWWALAIRGLAALIFGILTFVAPGVTIAVLVLWFGVYAFIDGVFSIVAAWRAPDAHARWGSLLLEGIAGILAGIFAFMWPVATAAVLVFLIAAWAIVTGILEIVAAVRLRRAISGEWALIAMGIISILFGIGLAIAPGVGAVVITLWIGAYAILFGVLLLVLAFRMRHWLRTRSAGPALGPA